MTPVATIGTAFPIAVDHPRQPAHQWLARLLDSYAWLPRQQPAWSDPGVGRAILAHIKAEPPAFQVEILIACVERMAWQRQEQLADPQHPTHYAVGSLLYGLACALYRRRLPFTETQLCSLLQVSKHQCGHGEDVRPPFDLALAYAQQHGLTPALLASLQGFMEGLRGLRASQAGTLRSKANLLFILAPQRPRGQPRCWSDRVRDGLRALPPAEHVAWEHLIAHMSVQLLPLGQAPKGWQAAATRVLGTLGPAQIVARLSAWWPDPQAMAAWPLTPAGSHLLKHFIWLLQRIPAADPSAEAATRLVCKLSALDWAPRDAGQKVMIAAADYLSAFPPATSWAALQRLRRWSALAPDGAREGKIDAILQRYQAAYPEVAGAPGASL